MNNPLAVLFYRERSFCRTQISYWAKGWNCQFVKLLLYLITEWWPLYMGNVLREWTHCPTSECHWIRWALENSGGELSVWRNGIAFSWYCSRRWKFTPLYISKLFILQGLDHMKVAKGLIFTRHPSLTWNISPLVAQSALKC